MAKNYNASDNGTTNNNSYSSYGNEQSKNTNRNASDKNMNNRNASDRNASNRNAAGRNASGQNKDMKAAARSAYNENNNN